MMGSHALVVGLKKGLVASQLYLVFTPPKQKKKEEQVVSVQSGQSITTPSAQNGQSEKHKADKYFEKQAFITMLDARGKNFLYTTYTENKTAESSPKDQIVENVTREVC